MLDNHPYNQHYRHLRDQLRLRRFGLTSAGVGLKKFSISCLHLLFARLPFIMTLIVYACMCMCVTQCMFVRERKSYLVTSYRMPDPPLSSSSAWSKLERPVPFPFAMCRSPASCARVPFRNPCCFVSPFMRTIAAHVNPPAGTYLMKMWLFVPSLSASLCSCLQDLSPFCV